MEENKMENESWATVGKVAGFIVAGGLAVGGIYKVGSFIHDEGFRAGKYKGQDEARADAEKVLAQKAQNGQIFGIGSCMQYASADTDKISRFVGKNNTPCDGLEVVVSPESFSVRSPKYATSFDLVDTLRNPAVLVSKDYKIELGAGKSLPVVYASNPEAKDPWVKIQADKQ